MLEQYLGFEIMSIEGLRDGPTAFWARATWDSNLTLYALSKPLLRKKIHEYWESQ